MADLVAELIRRAGDHGALSDELHFSARTRREREHLDHGRANVLRALQLPANARALEIGAEYGALTRYLGEILPRVDALEATPERASAAARRTADLPTVQVLTEPPRDAIYDLVVAMSDPPPTDLNKISGYLRPGGLLCLAVPNGVGVAQLNEHSGFGRARQPWENLLIQTGFTIHTVLGCLPDHRLARVVFAPELLEQHPHLAIDLAHLPDGQHELWSKFVHAGLGADTASGLVIVASAGATSDQPWPEQRLASFFNTDRAARWCTRGDVTRHEVRRSPLRPQRSDTVAVRAWTDPVRRASTISDVLVRQPWRAAELLVKWQELVQEQASVLGSRVWDLIPQNTLVQDGKLEAIDLEWIVADATPGQVVDRGLLLLAEELAGAGWAGAAPDNTVTDLAEWLGTLLHRPIEYVVAAADREAWFQAVRRCGTTDGPGLTHELERMRAAWHDRLRTRVGAPVAIPEFTGTEQDDFVRRVLANTDRTIAKNDTMFHGDEEHYFTAAEDGLRSCIQALSSTGTGPPRRVLDFGCGYGRVLRVLHTAFPSAELIACDTEREGTEYCRSVFGATILPGSPRIREIPQVYDVDLIWAGSVLTHLNAPVWHELLTYFHTALAPGGIAVLTIHGRRVARDLEHGYAYGLNHQRRREVLDQYRFSGFGYADYPDQDGYGISLSRPDWVTTHVLRMPMRLASYTEAGRDRHQDTLVLIKDG